MKLTNVKFLIEEYVTDANNEYIYAPVIFQDIFEETECILANHRSYYSEEGVVDLAQSHKAVKDEIRKCL